MIRTIPVDDIDTVKILRRLLISFLRYRPNKIHTERNNNNNNNENKIRTNSIGDMPLYGISPNKWNLCALPGFPRYPTTEFAQGLRPGASVSVCG